MSSTGFESFALRQPPVTHVFAYGTLRRGQANDITRLLPPPAWLGVAEVAGTLYDLGAYPGVVLGGASRVRGEVYAISAELERRLDEIECLYPEQTDEYFKRVLAVPVSVAGGGVSVTDCICYEYNPRHLRGAPVIASGDWLLRNIVM